MTDAPTPGLTYARGGRIMSPMTPTTTTTRPLAAAVAALADAIANYTPADGANTVTITYRGTSYDIATRGPVDHDDPHARYIVGCDHGYVYVDPHTGHGDLSDATDAAPMTWVDAVGAATTGVIGCIAVGVDPGTTWIDAAPIGARRTY